MPVTAVFFCFRGYLYVCNEIDNGPSGELEFVHLTTLEEGSFFGEQSFLARQSGHSALATATVEAGTYCELERLPFDGLQLLMAQEPELLLVDEPTASLDKANRNTVLELISEAKQRHSALVGIFHDAAVREAAADHEIDVSTFNNSR